MKLRQLLESLLESESEAFKRARDMGLDYMRFGRYGKDGKVTHVTKDGKLVPKDATHTGDTPQQTNPAKTFADKHHGDQKYGNEPYNVHLKAVDDVLDRFNVTDPNLRAAAWLHDTLEDTNASYEEVSAEFGEVVAQIVNAVTDGPGDNRKERKSHAYPKIRATPGAVAVKLADRIANVESGGKIDMYKKEYPDFKRELFNKGDDPTVQRMWHHLDTLLR